MDSNLEKDIRDYFKTVFKEYGFKEDAETDSIEKLVGHLLAWCKNITTRVKEFEKVQKSYNDCIKKAYEDAHKEALESYKKELSISEAFELLKNLTLNDIANMYEN